MIELGLLVPKIKKVRVKKVKPLVDMVNIKRSERLKTKQVSDVM